MAWRVFLALAAGAAPAFAQLRLQQVGFEASPNVPLFLTAAPGAANPNEVYVVEKNGRVRTLDTGAGTYAATPFLQLPAGTAAGQLATDGEQGLLGMAFGPGYSNGNGFVYVHYNANSAFFTLPDFSRVDRFTVSGGAVVAGSQVNILSFQQPGSNFSNHKGGWIGFGADNLLYVASGDGGGSNDPSNFARNLAVPYGKILRIDPSTTPGVGGFTVPAANPFAGSANATTRMVFASGLRNPFRSSFDRLTGDLYIGDVGQNLREEIDFIAAGSPGGQDFGWRALEGSGDNSAVPDAPPVGAVPPIFDYTHFTQLSGSGSVTGGYVYRGGDLFESTGQSLDGTYFFGDFVNGTIQSFRYDGATLTDFRDRTAELNSRNILGEFNLTSFGEDNLGRLYVVAGDGRIFRIVAAVPEPSALALVLAAAAAFGWRRRARA